MNFCKNMMYFNLLNHDLYLSQQVGWGVEQQLA